VSTNRDRLKLLKEKLRYLNDELHRKGLEPEYLQFLEQIAQGKVLLEAIPEEKWEVMLPTEKEQQLLHYYHTVRTEYLAMCQAAEESGETGNLREWLENPWVRISLTGVALTEITVKLLELAHAHGLFFREDEQSDYLG
jgi:hypothetical protein